MRKLTFCLLVVLGPAVLTAQAKVLTQAKYLALRISMDVDENGYATLTNTSDAPIAVWGFEFYSSLGRFDTGRNGWRSLTDWARFDPDAAFAALGYTGDDFMEIKATPYVLGEASMGNGFALFQPGVPISIGKPFLAPLDPNDQITFYYARTDFLGDKFLGAIAFTPEPATMSLAALAGAALLCRRRRRPVTGATRARTGEGPPCS